MAGFSGVHLVMITCLMNLELLGGGVQWGDVDNGCAGEVCDHTLSVGLELEQLRVVPVVLRAAARPATRACGLGQIGVL